MVFCLQSVPVSVPLVCTRWRRACCIHNRAHMSAGVIGVKHLHLALSLFKPPHRVVVTCWVVVGTVLGFLVPSPGQVGRRKWLLWWEYPGRILLRVSLKQTGTTRDTHIWLQVSYLLLRNEWICECRVLCVFAFVMRVHASGNTCCNCCFLFLIVYF